MSSPNHLTFGVEDAFSSNFPDFILASLDYVPASPGKTYSSSSNSFGVVPIASPTLLLFHDDPYMNVMHEFYAKKSPIPPPTIIPKSSMFNPQEFFLPEGLLPPKKRDELSLDRIEYIEDKIEGIRKGRKKQMGNNYKISLARFRITALEHIINNIQIRHQEDKENLLNALNELKISQEGPSDY
ncbi:hypothetical protein Tco_1016061 [Tanacetum coccineum]|uniref:BHLH domain-containing protein n=1 Tax=Tanacetum coccineum TaxID=301880 RepID=A0ABQ5FMM3_9ASTR